MDFSRVVDVFAAVPAHGTSFGSGYLVAPGLVLTARHVVCGEEGESYADPYVRFLADDTAISCRVAWAGPSGLDGALLEFTGPARSCQPVRWGQLISSGVRIGCEAAGFPRSMEQDEQDGGLRDVEHMHGEINAGTGFLGQRIYVDVTSARPQPRGWDGMSGAALWSGPLLIGVIVRDTKAFASGRLAAEAATRMLADLSFRALVGTGAVAEAVELARPRVTVAAPAPAYLLRADAETARFRSRGSELAGLTAWCESGEGVRARLLTGPGGQGKTRLASELAARLAATGQWTAELLASDATLPRDIRRPLLIVMDYAETRPQQVQQIMMTALAEPGHTPIRVLLLARSAGDWWDALRAETAELEMALAGAIVEELAPLEDTLAGRRQAFIEAVQDYGKALAAIGWPCAAEDRISRPDLSDSRFGSALRLQMTALAALLGDGTIGDEPAEEVILRHESRYWQRTGRQYDLHLHSQTVRNAVATAALCGAADLPDAVALLTHVPGLQDQSEDARLRTARWLRDLYPVSTHPLGRLNHRGRAPYWASPEPDLLAEHLVASVVDAVPDFLPGLLETTSADQNHQALTVLARAAVTRINLADSLAGLLSRLPHLAPTTVTVVTQSEQPGPVLAALTGLVRHKDLPAELLAAISDAIPRDTRALSRFAITVEQDLLAVRERLAEESPEAYLPDLAISLTNVSMRLGQAGKKEGLEMAQRAVATIERLAEESPEAYLLLLAISLSNLSAHLSNAGRNEEALAAIQRAVATTDRLAEVSPETSLPTLAGLLNNLATHLGDAGRSEEALAAAHRAVGLHQQLADDSPDAHLASLAWSLGNLAQRAAEAGRSEEALAAAHRAVGLFEQLADDSPDAHLENLAWSLDNLARRAGEAGRGEEALAAAHRAVGLYVQLADDSPDAHLENLARSLGNLAADLDEAGRRKEAQATAQRAVDVYRRLGQDNPEPYLSVLATSLNTQSMDRTALTDQPRGREDMSWRLDDVGPPEEALAAIQRAIAIQEPLAEANPDVYLPDLAVLLSHLSRLLSKNGRPRLEEALAAIQRAVAIRSRLAEANPDVHRPNLAASLSDLSIVLGQAGRPEEGLAAVKRAVAIQEPLAQARPDVHLPDLAASLINLSLRLGETGRPEEGLTAVKRAVAIQEPLAQARPDVHLPRLAMSLNYLSRQLDDVGQSEEALAARQRAIAIQEPLAQGRPDAYLPDLAASLNNVSVQLSKAGKRKEALAAIRRAVDTYERLAEASPAAYLPYLATSLINLSLRLRDAGQPEQSLAAKRRAVGIQEQLANARPDAHLPDPAATLYNLSVEGEAHSDKPRGHTGFPLQSPARTSDHPRRRPSSRPIPQLDVIELRSKCGWPTCKFYPWTGVAGLYRGWCWRHGRYHTCYIHLGSCPRCEYKRTLRAERDRAGPGAGM